MKQIYKKENRILLSMITGMIVISLLCYRRSQLLSPAVLSENE